ncbi:pyridoxal kinase PdxY [Fodinicurvata sediminis]|uniref:pyridoxal kinase PdxY n=1 Tax=Fodinicurvata sediminis TaxID=1121832 RepID=UPI0003B463C7|nr:pyridoxal kinase PdxY [Fodinicurvata sediminis]
MSILSVQSHVAYGYVGNRAAVFPLQRLGFDVWAVNTVQFSNHTGYGSWTGEIFTPEHISSVLSGIFERAPLESCEAVLSGYLGAAKLGETILSTVDRVREARPTALYTCDPVMGDVGRGIFVQPEIPDFMKQRAVPAADIITPNQFELELLTGETPSDLEHAIAAAQKARALGPEVVVVTSLQTSETPDDSIEMLAVSGEGAWRVRTPMLPLEIPPNGAGDAVTALFLAHYLKTHSAPDSLAAMAAAVFEIISATLEAGTRELQLIASQDRFVKPDKRFTPDKVG